MIDHTGVTVSNFEKSKLFYAKALAPLGYALLMEVSAAQTGRGDAAGFGVPPKPDFWIGSGTPNVPPVQSHFASQAASWSTRSMRLHLPREAAITALRACVPTTIQTTTAPSCLTRTATTSRPSAMFPNSPARPAHPITLRTDGFPAGF